MSRLPLRLPNYPKKRAAAQAETERYFAARAAPAVPGRARGILARAGQGNPPRPGDELDGEDKQA